MGVFVICLLNGISFGCILFLLASGLSLTLGLMGILWLTQSLRFVELAVDKGASLFEFMELTLLILLCDQWPLVPGLAHRQITHDQ